MRLWMLMVAVAVIALAMGFLESNTSCGVGAVDLEITFVVIDELTSKPIPRATLEFLEDPPNPSGVFQTNKAGEYVLATRVSTSSRNTWRKRTEFAHLPRLFFFRASASGHETSELVELASIENRQLLKMDFALSTLEVKIPLKKLPANASLPPKSVENHQP